MAECWVVKCPGCAMHHAKEQEHFGNEAQKGKCPHCGNTFVLKQNGQLVNARESTVLVQSLNGPEEYRGFGTMERYK